MQLGFVNQKTPEIIKGFSYLCNNQTTKNMTKLKEIWETIPKFPNYQVSNLGNVKSLDYNHTGKPRLLRQQTNIRGYKFVTLYNNDGHKLLLVARLVAECFIPNPLDKSEVNHKNGIKTDNQVNNLEWCTRSENELHAFRTGLKNGKEVNQLTLDGKFIKKYKTLKATGYDRGTISRVCRGIRQTAWGYKWEYA